MLLEPKLSEEANGKLVPNVWRTLFALRSGGASILVIHQGSVSATTRIDTTGGVSQVSGETERYLNSQ